MKKETKTKIWAFIGTLLIAMVIMFIALTRGVSW